MPLFIVPTPIGNLEDMTLRGLRVLREADVIACEDTRHTLRLLNHFEIKKPLFSCHEHNEAERVEMMTARLEAGEKVALVSDAGTPGLSDPGGVIIRAAMDRAVPIEVLPGANALLPALLLSGMDMRSFVFAGFLKGKEQEKRKRLEELKNIKETLAFYVSPHRLFKELALMGSVLGDRRAALVREITKIHEETLHGTLLSFCDTMPEEKVRGEFVCIVEGAADEIPEDSEDKWQEEVLALASAGEPVKKIAAIISDKYGRQPNKIKKFIIANCTGEEK